ncbi:hypothetical protein AMTRI_Chr05g70110 [Amborella trichopoda]
MEDLANASGWVVGGSETIPPARENITVELLDHIRESTTPKEAWDALATLSKTNDARLQFLESELGSYFTKVKSLCHEISKLDLESRISETKMRRIIIRGLRHEYNGFKTTIKGWQTQPTLLESRRDVECYNYGKKGHIARNCLSKKRRPAEGNTVIATSH